MSPHFGNGIIWDIDKVKSRHEKFIKKNYGGAVYAFSDLFYNVDIENLSVSSRIITTYKKEVGMLITSVTENGEIDHNLVDKCD